MENEEKKNIKIVENCEEKIVRYATKEEYEDYETGDEKTKDYSEILKELKDDKQD